MNGFVEEVMTKLKKIAMETLSVNEEQFTMHKEEYYACSTLTLNEVEEQIRDLEEYEDGWIPVSERQPEYPKDNEDEKAYIVTVKRIRDGFTFADKLVFHSCGWLIPSTCEVTAWQHLPKPYKPNKS